MINDIHARAPINKQTAIVVSEGYSFESKKIIQAADSHLPIPTIKLSNGMKDLTGIKFGKFVVIGFAKKDPDRWVVKCFCGVYTIRKARAITNPNNTVDQCAMCQQLEYIKHQELRKRIGDKADIIQAEQIKKSRQALPEANPRPKSANPI